MKQLKKKRKKYAPSLNVLSFNGISKESEKSLNNFGYVEKTGKLTNVLSTII